MKWNKYTVRTVPEAEDIIAASLMEIGIEGIEIEDSCPLTEDELSSMFVDIPPVYQNDAGVAKLHFYLDPEKDNTKILEQVREVIEELREFTEIGEGSIRAGVTDDKDWLNAWKDYFHQFEIDDILIVPSWEEPKAPEKYNMVLRIDPGTAFGTGLHETTQLCVRQLKKYVKEGEELLDVGTGSGILGIVACKLGAGHVTGTDLDPCCIPAVQENKASNQIAEEKMDLILGNIIDDPQIKEEVGFGKYDIVTANILAGVLVPLMPEITAHMKKGGVIITSGILDEKEKEVASAIEKAGMEILEVTYQNEWVSITARYQG